jgi:hypothetical protein
METRPIPGFPGYAMARDGTVVRTTGRHAGREIKPYPAGAQGFPYVRLWRNGTPTCRSLRQLHFEVWPEEGKPARKPIGRKKLVKPWCWSLIEEMAAVGPVTAPELAVEAYGERTPAAIVAASHILTRCDRDGFLVRVKLGHYRLPTQAKPGVETWRRVWAALKKKALTVEEIALVVDQAPRTVEATMRQLRRCGVVIESETAPRHRWPTTRRQVNWYWIGKSARRGSVHVPLDARRSRGSRLAYALLHRYGPCQLVAKTDWRGCTRRSLVSSTGPAITVRSQVWTMMTGRGFVAEAPAGWVLTEAGEADARAARRADHKRQPKARLRALAAANRARFVGRNAKEWVA